jgi:dephospho-CoA kinase
MITLGLTGSIGMGKSATAAMFAEEGCPVYDADAEVHRLYAKGGAAVGPVEAAFPGVEEDGAINRAKLSARVLGDDAALKLLTAGIVWPLMSANRREFFRKAEEDGVAIVVVDVPLLYETGGERNMDAVVVVTAPAEMQRQRVLAREDMDEAKLDAILARQMADEEKRARAHFIVDTSQGFDAARSQVRDIIATLKRADWREQTLVAARERPQ